jgi:hypothetical protein
VIATESISGLRLTSGLLIPSRRRRLFGGCGICSACNSNVSVAERRSISANAFSVYVVASGSGSYTLCAAAAA